MATQPTFVAGGTARNKLSDVDDAVRLIRDQDVVIIGGFAGICFPEALVLAVEKRFLETGSPRELTLIFPVAAGDLHGRGLDRLAHPGLIARAIGAHFSFAPGIQKLAVGGEIEAWNLPLGVMSHLFRDLAGGKPGTITAVGLGTFADPRHGGGKVNSRTTGDLVQVVELGGEEFLLYKLPKPHVALLRGTTADPDGNITMEREALTLESLPIATLTHNARGLVLVQVARLAERSSLRPREVKIPGVMVDALAVGAPEHHWQTFGSAYTAAYSGELRIPMGSVAPLALNARKVIARRAAMELHANSVVNLGVGIPEGVASVANEEHILEYLTLTAEPGVIGGMPVGGLDFGAAVNAQAIIDLPAQFDFYDGGGLDYAFLGLAQADAQGCVNVSRFGPKLSGAGGFVNISQNARSLIFLGTFVAGGKVSVREAELMMDDSGATPKFIAEVEQRTYDGQRAASTGQPVLFITERCVLRLTGDGLEVVEIAPGVDLERDIFRQMGFTPLVSSQIRPMDPRIFAPGLMGLKSDLLDLPMASRFSYDEHENRFFLNFEGLAVTSEAQLEAIRHAVDAYLSAIGRKVDAIVNYDNFYCAPEVLDAYTEAVRRTADSHYLSVARYTTSSFMRLKLGAALERSDVVPHIYERPPR